MNEAFRPCVLAVFQNEDGLVLMAERQKPRGAWQFPQGGIEPGETAEAALAREMREELGVTAFAIVRRVAEPIAYDFPTGTRGDIAQRYRGQAQVWFLVRLAADAGVDLARASDHEFVDVAWVDASEALRRIVAFKKDAYGRGLRALGLVP
jgi:putative (di)nucleoside polyphosphate hydrolase